MIYLNLVRSRLKDALDWMRIANRASERVLQAKQQVMQAEQALQDQRQQLEISARHIPAAVAMFDNHMRYLSLSDRWLEDYSIDAASTSIIGKTHYEIFPDISDEWKRIHEYCLEGHTKSCDEDAYYRADGSTHYMKWAIHPWYNRAGAVGGITMYTEDVTERKQARAELQQAKEAAT